MILNLNADINQSQDIGVLFTFCIIIALTWKNLLVAIGIANDVNDEEKNVKFK